MFFFIIVLLYVYSPLVSVFGCIVYSIYNGNSSSKIVIISYGFILSLSLATLYSGKLLTTAGSSDFLIYFQYYKLIIDGALFSDFRFEYGYFVLNNILSFFDLNEIEFSIVMNFITIFLNYVAVYFVIIKQYKCKNILLILILSCFLFKIGSLTLLWRQSIACAFIIFALFSKGKFNQAIFFIIAISFHTSSIVIFPIVYFIINYRLKKIYFLIVIFIGVTWQLFLGDIVFSMLPSVLANKLNISLRTGSLLYFMDGVKTVIYFIPILVVCFINGNRSKEFNILLFTVIFILFSATITHAFRIIFPLSVVLSAMYASILLVRDNNKNFIALFIIIMLAGFARFFVSNIDLQFDYVGIVPFYFLTGKVI
ncbi:hypothetical protein C9I86_16805 [Photobacterium sp. NCIMB 13483]|uniref:EpsG family protein n=1 Tax=Photobacterium sp. NCIMB 13483 TaxID=2022103 RepID=UPI000D17AAEC|nr:EpsG family protein [Photobacterium sp. NCIMB 13483]PST85895.1 hypothetical protein C9I86_16805 [Photobacterium sp. NCIMB 13483]